MKIYMIERVKDDERIYTRFMSENLRNVRAFIRRMCWLEECERIRVYEEKITIKNET